MAYRIFQIVVAHFRMLILECFITIKAEQFGNRTVLFNKRYKCKHQIVQICETVLLYTTRWNNFIYKMFLSYLYDKAR